MTPDLPILAVPADMPFVMAYLSVGILVAVIQFVLALKPRFVSLHCGANAMPKVVSMASGFIARSLEGDFKFHLQLFLDRVFASRKLIAPTYNPS